MKSVDKLENDTITARSRHVEDRNYFPGRGRVHVCDADDDDDDDDGEDDDDDTLNPVIMQEETRERAFVRVFSAA